MLVSYPKSGSTWLRFLLGHLLTGTEQDFDSVRNVLPPIGSHRDAPRVLAAGGRLLRSHEPVAALDRSPVRIVYLLRDGRDVAASYYHHHTRMARSPGGPCPFVEDFLAGRVDGYGSWATHVLTALERRDRQPDDTLVMTYEDLRADTAGALTALLSWLGAQVDPDRIASAVAANSKSRMRAKEATSTFLQARPSDGTPFVRADGECGWPDLFAGCADHLDLALREPLAVAGYRTG